VIVEYNSMFVAELRGFEGLERKRIHQTGSARDEGGERHQLLRAEAGDGSRAPSSQRRIRLWRRGVAGREGVRAGELLFVPVGCWHQVRALEPSIGVTLTNFAFPNRYAWDTDTSR
jgi:hypothetical protein